MRKVWFVPLIVLAAGCEEVGQDLGSGPSWKRFARPAGTTEWAGAIEVPSNLKPWADTSAPSESGERMAISGTVFKPDGRTPAAGVLIYFYHTNAKGVYPTRGDEKGNGRRHGYLRGWILTGPDGKYEMRGIKPGNYPSGRAPAHIHLTLTANGHPEHWVDEVWFEGDPYVTAEEVARGKRHGSFNPIVKLTKDNTKTWRGLRDLKLELPSPNNGGATSNRPPE
ncbi:MAG TPA: hypothetical protein PLX06_03430 [Fimbriimonadaceae bacterium]|nr:hypothetical protein [Fimbriimonadaceae bacterium]